MATSIKYQNYVVHINDNGIVTISKDGVLFRNQKGGSRELASVLHLDIEPDFRRKKINRLIIQEIARLNGIEVPEISTEENEDSNEESKKQLGSQTKEVQSNNANDEDLDDDEDEEYVTVDGVDYTPVMDDDLTTPLYFTADFLEDDNDAKEITIQSEITWPATGKKYPVTGFSISDGEFMRVILPSTIDCIAEAFTERNVKDRKQIEVVIPAACGMYMKDRIFYDKGGNLQNAFLAEIEGSFTVPSGTTSIWSLQKQKKMVEVIIPSSVKEINSDAFDGCSSLRNINIYNNRKNVIWTDDEGEKSEEPTIENCRITYIDKSTTIKKDGQVVYQSDNAASQTPISYQKKYQAMYDAADDHDSVWDRVIPENAEEMLGALMFCKAHKDDWHKFLVVRTLKRLIELCGLYYADNNEINRILPSVKQIVQEYEDTEAKEKKKKGSKELRKKRFIWIWVALCVILIIIQAIFWGLWAILSGAVTVVVFGGVLLLCDMFIWD